MSSQTLACVVADRLKGEHALDNSSLLDLEAVVAPEVDDQVHEVVIVLVVQLGSRRDLEIVSPLLPYDGLQTAEAVVVGVELEELARVLAEVIDSAN